jgi:Ribonuclease HI
VWIYKWKQNDWKLSDGGQVKNKDDLMALDEALEGISVKWVCNLKTQILKLSYAMKSIPLVTGYDPGLSFIRL